MRCNGFCWCGVAGGTAAVDGTRCCLLGSCCSAHAPAPAGSSSSPQPLRPLHLNTAIPPTCPARRCGGTIWCRSLPANRSCTSTLTASCLCWTRAQPLCGAARCAPAGVLRCSLPQRSTALWLLCSSSLQRCLWSPCLAAMVCNSLQHVPSAHPPLTACLLQVHRLAPPETPQHELRLRIRCALMPAAAVLPVLCHMPASPLPSIYRGVTGNALACPGVPCPALTRRCSGPTCAGMRW